MSTLIIENEYTDDLLYLNEETMYGYSSPFHMDDLYPTSPTNLNTNDSFNQLSDCSSEEEEFDIKMLQQPQAPPPSPQAQPMLDLLFSKKLNASLEACINHTTNIENDIQNETTIDLYSDTLEHAQTLDKLLRRTLKNDGKKGGSISKNKHKRSCSLQLRSKSTAICNTIKKNQDYSWQARAQNQKLEQIAKATEHSEKLKLALQRHLMEEETSLVINELRDMGL
jgi:hypothetical protein